MFYGLDLLCNDWVLGNNLCVHPLLPERREMITGKLSRGIRWVYLTGSGDDVREENNLSQMLWVC